MELKMNIIENEIISRNEIETQYNKYIELYQSYFDKCYSIIKYMFINIYDQKKNIEARDMDLNNFFKNNFKKVFVLNGLSNIEKRFQMMEKMLMKDIDFEFFDICENNSPESYILYLDSESNLDFENWCFYESIKQLLIKAREKKYEKIFILDNNACLNNNIYNELKYNKKIYQNWEIIIFDSFDDAKQILHLKSFAISSNCYDDLLNNLDLNKKLSEIFKNIIYLEDIVKSDISDEDIVKFKKNNDINYERLINNLIEKKLTSENENEKNKLNNQIKLIKHNIDNNKYIYVHKNKSYEISLSYQNMLENFKNYYNYLDNKKIVLIGPSPSIRKTKNGDFIDKNYDVVVKINNAIFNCVDSEYIGERIDVLYTLSIAQDLKQIKIDEKYNSFAEYFFERVNELKIKYIVFSNDLHSQIHNQWLSLIILRFSEIYNIYKIPILFLDSKITSNHFENAKKIPSAGFGAIMNLTQYKLMELFLKGFTFFKDGHTNSYIGKDWLSKVDKVNLGTKKKLTEEKKEKIIHSIVKNQFVNISPHHFDYEYKKTNEFKIKYSFIKFDASISELFE